MYEFEFGVPFMQNCNSVDCKYPNELNATWTLHHADGGFDTHYCDACKKQKEIELRRDGRMK